MAKQLDKFDVMLLEAEARRLLKKLARQPPKTDERLAKVNAALERAVGSDSSPGLTKVRPEPKSSDDDVPTIVARVRVETEQTGQTYEEANWPKLSPMFRAAHNR